MINLGLLNQAVKRFSGASFNNLTKIACPLKRQRRSVTYLLSST